MKEHIDFRANLERLNELYPGTEMLNISQSAQVMGYKTRETAKKKLHFKDNRISKVTLARIMCGQ